MSLSHFRHPFDIAKHPTLEPEVKRAILASWASDANTVTGKPAMRRLSRRQRPAPVDEIMSALKLLDRGKGAGR